MSAPFMDRARAAYDGAEKTGRMRVQRGPVCRAEHVATDASMGEAGEYLTWFGMVRVVSCGLRPEYFADAWIDGPFVGGGVMPFSAWCDK